MTYDEYRRNLIEQYYDYQLESFINGYAPGKRNVILLPGGMGSQLERTSEPFPASPNVINDVVWLDFGISPPFDDALSLEIDNDGRDHESYVIGAHGPVSFIGTTPYNELEDLARKEDWNFCVFGFDWRRSLAESTGHFQRFIQNFDSGVKEKYGSNQKPIKALTVVCHSMGGLVCTDALRNPNFARLGFQAIVTIATPFYGTSTHQERYFRGVESLNKLYNRKTVVRIIAAIPGPYALMLLPKVIYDRNGANLGLTRYPQYDHDNGTDTDPYDPAMMDRWPQPVRDHRQFLAQARDELIRVAEPIDKVIAPVFHNVRSSLDNKTAVELKWKNMNGDHIPDGSSPLTGVEGAGDGTVPAWSAFHAHCRAANRHELASAQAHGELLEHPEVLTLIKSFVNAGRRRAVAKRLRVPAVADQSKVASLMAAWSEKAKHNQPPPPGLFDKTVQRAFVTNLIAGDKPKMEAAPKKGPLRKGEAASPKKASAPKKKTPQRKKRR